MASYKYPYIPKEYYAAVMYACKIIRETGNFNRAVRIASSYYDVDDEILERHIRKRQGAGQKGKASPTKNKKYKYFVVAAYNHVDDADAWYVDVNSCPDRVIVKKGISKDNVYSRLSTMRGVGPFDRELPIYDIIAERDNKSEADDIQNEILQVIDMTISKTMTWYDFKIKKNEKYEKIKARLKGE